MRHFPIFLDLAGQRALLLGGGAAAAGKREMLEAAGAEVVQVGHFLPEMLDGMALAIGLGEDEAGLVALAAEGRRRGVPVNIVDRPELCSFIMPAIVNRDPVTIAVSSGGVAPVLSRLLRARIEAAVPPAFGRLGALAAQFKAEIRRLLPDLTERRRVLERVFSGRTAELVFAGDEAGARVSLQRELTAGGAEPGMVFLVGAGPGAADLMTLRAQRLLGEADVIVHDRLVGAAVLDLARRDAERVYVGKMRANHSLPQEQINALLIDLARQGRKVVRLKGGDPFVFGRGGEEAEALEAAGIPYEVVPGVTAALACAAQAKIPLTHRDASRSVTFLTGHSCHGGLDIDFDTAVKQGGTLAIYMGIVTLAKLREGLIAAGMAASMPAALIERGGTPEQRLLCGTIGTLPALAADWGTGGPTLVLVGAAVARGALAEMPAAEAAD